MPVSALIITATQLRAQIGKVTDDPRFAEGIQDSILQGIIDRHVGELDSRAEEVLFSGLVNRDVLEHLAEPVEIALEDDTMVAKGDMPAGYVRWSYGAYDSAARALAYETGLLDYAEVSPFSTARYRVIGSHVEVLPRGLSSIQLYLVTSDAARDALLSDAHKAMGASAADVNRKIILEAMAAIEEGRKQAAIIEQIDSHVP